MLLGNKNSGKTSIFNRYVYDEFGDTHSTIGAYFGMKQCKIGGEPCNLAIWDTAGEEKFDSLTNFYCRNARVAMLCYDITCLSSFESLRRWITKVKSEAERDCVMIIIGNKLDLVQSTPDEREVPREMADKFAKSIGCMLVEASAKTGKHINEGFHRVVMESLKQAKKKESRSQLHGRNLAGSGLRIEDTSSKMSRCC